MSIQKILDDLKIDYKITGDEAKANCPNHEDIHPSWYCNLKTGLHYCFACHYRGNIYNLVQTILDCSFSESLSYCYIRTGLSQAEEWLSPKEIKKNVEVDEYSLSVFSEIPEERLKERNLSAYSAERFGVRWNNKNNSWILPLRDPYTQKLLGWQEKKDKSYRFFPGGLKKSLSLFGLSAAEYGSGFILTESPLDSVRLCSAGFRNSVSGFGVHISTEQLSLIHEFSGYLILALDSDYPGIFETSRICREFKQLPVYVFNYGNSVAKDPGEMSDEEIKFGIENKINRVYWRE